MGLNGIRSFVCVRVNVLGVVVYSAKCDEAKYSLMRDPVCLAVWVFIGVRTRVKVTLSDFHQDKHNLIVVIRFVSLISGICFALHVVLSLKQEHMSKIVWRVCMSAHLSRPMTSVAIEIEAFCKPTPPLNKVRSIQSDTASNCHLDVRSINRHRFECCHPPLDEFDRECKRPWSAFKRSS